MLVVISTMNHDNFDGYEFEGTTHECVEAVQSLLKDELKGQRFEADFYDGSTVLANYTVVFYQTGLTLTTIHSN
jgi:hypothetical protein